ncbi:NAD-dependent epimerase/dehydratase family protein [Pseudomonas sp. 2FG]|uniref:NAD-dependent epimerase/dehydratase family protein n=1 Tax=Pseudomonas sp. 2FG TaxID=2502191 RepID=UPI001484D6AB|nr:NAD-dependent epimerase/dehydratase family protein [Pseudomonas sp. 2FG]
MASVKSYKRAVILGAAGFIGINLANTLAEQGYELICFDRASSPQWPVGAKAIIGDFASLPAELLEALDNALVFHLVSSCRPSPSTAQAAEEVSLDLATTLRYLEATKARNLRWVFLSSGGTVYGQQDSERIVETSSTEPICSYGLVKVAIEKYFALYRTLYGLDYVIARLANPYGPWQHPLRGQGIIAALTYKALKGDTIEIWGDGANIRDYIYITDATQGILAAAWSGKSGEIYNIGTSMGHSINQLIEILGKSLELELKVNYSAARSVDVKRNVLDNVKITAHTGWKPSTTIESGIALTASWIEHNLKLW